MKYIVSILSIFLFAFHSEAQDIVQQLDSLRQPTKAELQLKDQVKNLIKFDTVSQKPVGYVDTVALRMNTVKNKLQLQERRLDSMKNKTLVPVDSVITKINGVNKNILAKESHAMDSVTNITNKYESAVKQKITSLINTDSLKNSNALYNKVTGKLDSVKNLDPGEKIKKPQAEIEKVQTKVQGLENNATSKVDEKLNVLSKQTEGQGNLPGNISPPNTNLDVNKVSDNIKVPDLRMNEKLPSLKQPSVDGTLLDNKLDSKVDLPKGLNNINPKKLNDAINIDEAGKLLKNAGDISKATGQVKGYANDVKSIESGNLDKVKTIKEDVISKVPVKNELTEIQKQDQLIKDQQAKLQSYKNPEAYKKQALARSKQMVAAQMATFEKQLQENVDKVSKYQSKLGTVLSKTSEMSQKRDKLRHLRMYEKFVPGVTFQVLKSGSWIVDINPSIRYRLTSYWSIGSGWNERVLFGKYSQPYDQTHVYCIRSFTEVIIFKGISVRLDLERMNTSVVTVQQTQDERRRAWSWNYMAGIKKEFSFIPKVIGNVQFMYNVYTSNNSSNAYPSRFNVRLGFEPILKKRLKKSKG